MTGRQTAATLAFLGLLGTIGTPAAAQVVDVRVKVDAQAIREVTEEIRAAMREAFGPEVRDTLRHELSSATREIAEVIEHLARTPWLGDGVWSDAWSQRNFPAAQTDTETRTFAIGTSGEFDLDNLAGDIRIRPGSGRNLTVEITRRARGRTAADARTGLARVRVETTHRGERATARTVYPSGRQSDYSVSVDYLITAPAGTRITAKTVSGDVTVGATRGELSIHTTSGDVTITDASRVMTAKTISGDIVLRNCETDGALEASTVSGDVTAINVKARRLTLQAISGSVTSRNTEAATVKLGSMSDDVLFEGDLMNGGRYEFTSQSGDVRLTISDRTGFTFEATSFSGTVRSDLAIETVNLGSGRRRTTRTLRGTFGDGSATVSATSFSGSVIVTRR